LNLVACDERFAGLFIFLNINRFDPLRVPFWISREIEKLEIVSVV
jgi:hypothetical protein